MGEEDERREKQDRVEREVGREGEEKRGGNERACGAREMAVFSPSSQVMSERTRTYLLELYRARGRGTGSKRRYWTAPAWS